MNYSDSSNITLRVASAVSGMNFPSDNSESAISEIQFPVELPQCPVELLEPSVEYDPSVCKIGENIENADIYVQAFGKYSNDPELNTKMQDFYNDF